MRPKVLIIGAGLTGLSTAYYLKNKGIDITILESDSKTGGVIQTISNGEFLYETGPNTGVLSNTEIEDLIQEISSRLNLETAKESSKKRLILKNNLWHYLPTNLFSFIFTPLFSFKDKIKLLFEPFVKPGDNPEESIKDLTERRLGKSFHLYAVAPFISGIYAGNTENIVTKYALPKLYDLEQKYGSFIKGAIKKKKEIKNKKERVPTKKIFSFSGGLSSLIYSLEQAHSNNIQLNSKNIKITKNLDSYTCTWTIENKEYSEEFNYVVSTVPSKNLQDIFPLILKDFRKVFNEIEYAPVIQVTLGFKNWNGTNINAFGGLIPPCENRNVLGVLFLSSMFRNRAPKEGALLSVFLGGSLKKEILQKSDEEILNIVKTEITDLFKIEDYKPVITHISKYNEAIAQYNAHYKFVFESISTIENENKKLYITGGFYEGIGIPDRVKQAKKIATQILEIELKNEIAKIFL